VIAHALSGGVSKKGTAASFSWACRCHGRAMFQLCNLTVFLTILML